MSADPTRASIYRFIPTLLILTGLIVFMGGRIVGSYKDHNALLAARDGQTKTMQDDVPMRQQLTYLAGAVARMAQSGDPDAQAIVDQFAKDGIKLVPPKTPAPANGGK